MFAIAGLRSMAQAPEHLSFKGVPINGTLNEFVAKMLQSGLDSQSIEPGFAMLKGEFAGYSDCIIGVSALKKKDIVFKIGVVFTERKTWSSLSGNYFNLKEMLINKYGSPTNVTETFQTSQEPTDDNAKFYEVLFDRCKYFTTWETDKGTIQLSIQHLGVTSCFVKLGYFDKINGNIIDAAASDDL